MNFSGAALGGLTPNVTSVFFSINKSIVAGLAPVSCVVSCSIVKRRPVLTISQASILGLSSQSAEDSAFLMSRLKTEGPYNSTGFLATLNYTLSEAIIAYAFQDIGEYFIGGVSDIRAPISTRSINRDGIMGYHGVPQMPLFAYKAIEDEVSPINDTDTLVQNYCKGECLFCATWEALIPSADSISTSRSQYPL